MIEIKAERKDNRMHLQCNGHSGYSEYGTDIVCAAVSTLVCGFAQCCVEEKDIVIEKMEMQPGHCDIEVVSKNIFLQNSYEFVRKTLKTLSIEYEKNILWSGEKSPKMIGKI